MFPNVVPPTASLVPSPDEAAVLQSWLAATLLEIQVVPALVEV